MGCQGLEATQTLSASTAKEGGTQTFDNFCEWPSRGNWRQLRVYISGKPGLVKPILTHVYGLELMSIAGEGSHFLVKQQNAEMGPRAS